MFIDRVDAGRQLAQRLRHLQGQDVVVMGLPRGGVPVAYEVAKALRAPLDVIVVRKLGHPRQPELAVGAIGEDEVLVLNRDVLSAGGITERQLLRVQDHEQARLRRRVAELRRGRPRVDVGGRVVVIVDDGLATGATAQAACRVARGLGAARVVLAVPVAAADAHSRVPEADELLWVVSPTHFAAVGRHYRDFTPTSDEEVARLLDAARPGC